MSERGFDHSRTDQLLDEYRVAVERARVAGDAALRAEEEADAADAALVRLDKDLNAHFQLLKAEARVKARNSA